MKNIPANVALVFAASIAVLIIVAAYFIKIPQNKIPSSVPTLNPVQNLIAEMDTDGDGLKDWEEALWGTNPQMEDSDKDGTKDGEEVLSGRNPKVAGPKDLLAEKAAELPNAPTAETITEGVAKDLLTKYFTLRTEGGLGGEVKDYLVSSMLLASEREGGRVYAEGDVKITEEKTLAALKQYGNEMGAAIKKHAVQNENELDVLGRAVSTKNPNELKKLEPAISAYEKTLEDMLRIAVPRGVLGVHLEILNSTSALLYIISGWRITFEDPVRAMVGAGKYVEAVNRMIEAFRNSKTWFATQGVIFSANEDANYLINLLP